MTYGKCGIRTCESVGDHGLRRKLWKATQYYCRVHAMRLLSSSTSIVLLVPPYKPPPVKPNRGKHA